MKKNKRHRGIYMMTAACLLIGAIGGVAAYENRPDQKVPDLQLTVGQSGYDLMAGITYDSEKYTLSVEDTGGLDINRIGKYEVTYALTPLEVPSTEKIPETTEVPSTEVTPDSTEVPSTETVPGQTPDQTQPPSTETAPGTTPDTGTPDAGTTPGAGTSPDKTGTPGAGTSPDQTGTPGAGTTPGKTDTPAAGTTPDKTDTPGAGTTSGTTTDKTGTPASGTVTNDPLGGELEEAQPEDNSGASAKPTDISAVTESIFGTVSAAEITDTQTEGVKYLTRTVWVVAGTDSIFIGYEEEDVQIKANEALYELVLIKDDTEQTTGTEPQYELVLKKPELLTEGIRVTDSAASLYNGASVTVTDDSELKNAVNIETAEDGTKTIKNINFGTYIIEVTAEDQSTGKKASCTRTVTVEGEGIRFDAPPLCIGTQDIDYDLTTDVTAVDECGNPVEEIYVVDDSNLQAAKKTVVDEETGEEKEQYIAGSYLITLGAKHPVTEQEFQTEREVEVTNGFYLYGPAIEIEVGSTNYDVLDGLQLRSFDEAVEGDEAASTFAADEIADSQLEFSIGDSSQKMLETNSMNDEELFEYIEEMEEREIETDAAKEALSLTADEAEMSDSLPLKEGVYPVEVQAVDKTSGDTYTGTRMVIVRSVQNNDAMAYQVKAYVDAVQDPYKDGDISCLGDGTLPEPYVKRGNVSSGAITFPVPSQNLVNAIHFSTNRVQGQAWYGQNYSTYQYANGVAGKYSLAREAGLRFEYEIVTLSTPVRGITSYVCFMPREYRQAEIHGTKYSNALYKTYDAAIISMVKEPYVGWYWKGDEFSLLPYLDQCPKEPYNYNKASWNNFIGGQRNSNLPTMKEGGSPDVLVTANKLLTQDNLDFQNMTNSFQDITPESSIEIDMNGQVLKGVSNYQYLPAMQISIENAKPYAGNSWHSRMAYRVPTNGYLRIKGFQTDNQYKDNTIADNFNNKTILIHTDGEATVEFHGGDDPNNPDEVYAVLANSGGTKADIILRTVHTGGDIKTPKRFMVESGTMEYTVDAAQGTKIEAFNLNGNKDVPAASLTLGGGGMLRFNKDLNIVDVTNMYANAIANKVELTGELSVLKSDKAPVGTPDAFDLAAIDVRGALITNGNKIAAGVNKENSAAPTQNEVFAVGTCVLDPTDFTVNKDNNDNAWVDDGTWFMANATDDNKKIVFMQDAQRAQAPIQVTHNGNTVTKATYKDAFDYIESQADTAYTVTCLRPMDFTVEDFTALKSMAKTDRSITFTGETTGAGKPTYGDRYHVRFHQSVVDMPAGYDITWDQPVKYDEDKQDGNHLEFIKNGKTLTFGQHYLAANIIRENANTAGTFDTLEAVVDVYGGAANGTFSTPSVINIKAGKFQSVYGGNKEGSHAGNTTITVDSTAVEEIAIGRLDGASAGEQTKPGTRTATISTTGNVTIQNLYNYDELTVTSGALTIPNGAKAKETNLNAQQAAGYIGKTILNDEATLKLLNANGIRKLGSLARPAGADATKTASVVLQRAVTEGTSGANSKSNPYLVELTATDPLNIDSFTAGRRISVSYDDSTTERVGDIIFNLTGVADTPEAKKKYVTVRSLKQSFTNTMISDQTDKTIKLVDNSVLLLNDKGKIICRNMDIAGALVELAQKEEAAAGGTYTIAIFKEGYTVSALDREAMDLVLGKTTGKFHYQGEDYNNLAQAANAAKVTWSGGYNSTGNKKANATTVHPEGNLVLFGAENVLTGMKLNYTGVTGDKNIYANDRPLTLGPNVSIEGNVYPGLYGGPEKGTGTKKELTVLTNVTLQDVKDFRSLAIGNGGTTQTTLTIAGTLDSDPSKTDNTRTDTVSLKNAVLKFTGTAEGHIGNLTADGNSNNTINIFKDAKGTKPLHLDGKVTLTDSKQLNIAINGQTAEADDLVLVFSKNENAKIEQYKHSTLKIITRLNKVYLTVNGKYFVTSQNISGYINQFTNNGGKDTLYYLSTFKDGNFNSDPDWNNFGTRKGEADVTIIPLQQPNGNELNLQDLKAQIKGMDKDSSILYDFTKEEATGTGYAANVGTYQIPNMTVTVRMAQYDGMQMDVTEAGGTFVWDRCYMSTIAITNESFIGYVVASQPRFRGKKLNTFRYIFPEKQDRILFPEMGLSNVADYIDWRVLDGNKENLTAPEIMNYNKMVVDTASSGKMHLAGIITTGNNHYGSGISDYNASKDKYFEIKGTGELWQNSVQSSGGWQRSDISTGTFVVNGIKNVDGTLQGPTLYKGWQYLGYGNSLTDGRNVNTGAIKVHKEYISNGFKLIIKGGNAGTRDKFINYNYAERELTWNGNYSGEIIAEAYSSGILDATDFDLQSKNYKQKNQYLTSANSGKNVIVTVLAQGPIRVSPAVRNKTDFETYKAALEAIQSYGTGAEYTITNLIERDFTAEDYKALQAVTADKAAGLIFESGARADNDGAAGNRYRVRMRVQTLELPKAVNVTFRNIVMKYDQGENSEIAGSKDMVVAGNGGILKFGEGVVFLQHMDATMKPTVYGGSVNGTSDTLSTVIINSGTFKAVYGAGTVPQTRGASVSISGGSVDKVFAGGTGAGTVTGDTGITVTGGDINCPVYGGGEDAKVTGNTTVVVSGGNFDNSTDKSVYGGGKAAEVDGKSDITITIDNSAGGKTLLCKNVSASGTDENGNLADNVKKTGMRNTITINSKVKNDKTKKAGLELERLSGFDTLTIGNDGETDNNNFIVSITKRFDSRTVDLAAEDNNRQDTVALKSAWLKLLGDWQGHIGILQTTGKTALTIYKDNQGTRPLLLDALPSLDQTASNKVQLKASDGDNEMGEVMLTFTFRQEKDTDPAGAYLPKRTYSYFEDGLGSGLNVMQLQTGTGADTDPVDIMFEIPPAHTVSSFVEYPVENGRTALDMRGTVNKKILHFSYDKDNRHNVRTGNGVYGGYVVALPKKTVADETEMLKYTVTDTQFKKDGKSFKPETQALNPVMISFTKDTKKPGNNPEDPNNPVYEAHGWTVDERGNKKAMDIDNENYWYVAHIVCDHNENYTFLLDVEAPKADAAAVKVLGTELDSKTGNYIYTLEVTDPSEGDNLKLPYYKVGRAKIYLNYTGNGVQAGYYAVSSVLNQPNDTADVEASKNPNTKWDLDRPATGEQTGLYDNVEITKRDGGKPVVGNTPAVVKATISREVVEANRTGAVWAYAKDDLNNTTKVQIPLSENIIDVSVPMQVNVIAVKKSGGGTAELLAPTCYIVNNGTKQIEAKVSGFDSTPQPDLKLSDKAKTDTFNADEIALFIKGADGNTFAETNVLTLDHTPLGIGTLGKASEDTRTKAYTFDAAYDVKNINVPDGFISKTMSYHFSVVQGGN